MGTAARQRHKLTGALIDSDAAICGKRSALHKQRAASSAACLLKVLHHDFHAFCVAQVCVVRLALHEAHSFLTLMCYHVLKGVTHVLKGVFRALRFQPGYPSFAKVFQ